MKILGIETSCDETAAAIVADGYQVISNVVYTQIPLHQPYGGVVPEIASRAHIEKISEVIRAALTEKVDAVAVTYGPGLAPALIVGLNAAKGLATALGVPLIAINHIEAHLHTPFLNRYSADEIHRRMPALGLAISGGHTNWFDMPEYGRYEILGQTLDDAAGEAFDKAAKLLGLGYPGGPLIDKLAKEYLSVIASREAAWQSNFIPFPKGMPREGVSALAGLPAELCVSFSGLKTALLRYVQKTPDLEIPRVVASYQEAIVQVVADRTRRALKRRDYRSLIVGGGVSLNSRLRTVLAEVAHQAGVELLTAEPKFCGDNAAMIAGLAYYRQNIIGDAAMVVDANPSLEV